jgi:hypothetical protein
LDFHIGIIGQCDGRINICESAAALQGRRRMCNGYRNFASTSSGAGP